jgi:hypothetical protein
MTCEEFELFLLDSDQRMRCVSWMLQASKMALAREHVDDCAACAIRMAESTRLRDALDQLRISTMHSDAPASVERKLLATFREDVARRHPGNTYAFPWKLAWVSIATLVLVVATALLYSKLRPDSARKEEVDRNASEEVISPRFVPDSSSAAASVIDRSREPGTENPRTALRHHFAPAHMRITEAGVAVVQASDVLSLNGGGSVVRVTLPISSLVAMGVPVHPDLSESRVTADVWMDPFGAVVGVRLVPANASAD